MSTGEKEGNEKSFRILKDNHDSRCNYGLSVIRLLLIDLVSNKFHQSHICVDSFETSNQV